MASKAETLSGELMDLVEDLEAILGDPKAIPRPLLDKLALALGQTIKALEPIAEELRDATDPRRQQSSKKPGQQSGQRKSAFILGAENSVGQQRMVNR